MEVSTLIQQQESLQQTLLELMKTPKPHEKADFMAKFLENVRSMVVSLSRCASMNIEIRKEISANLLKMSQYVISGLTRLSRADMEEPHYRQQTQVVAQLLGLLLRLPLDDSAKTEVVIVGIAHLWRLIFCHSDDSMDTSPEILRARSVRLTEVLPLVIWTYRKLDCGQNTIQLCYIMLEVFRHSDVNQHISNILATLTRVPKGVNLAHIYPGLVSRIVANLSKLRESDFASAMRVLESWIREMLTCECTGTACRKNTDPALAGMAAKTSDAICHIFSKFSTTYSQHMSGLCDVCLHCGCISPEAFHQLQLFLVQLLRDEASWPTVRRLIGTASSYARIGLWQEVTSCLRSQVPEALKVYLGYVDLLTHVPDLEELDDYVTMELMYSSVEPPRVDTNAATSNFGGLALCDEVIDLGIFTRQHEALFTRVAAHHVARMSPIRQQQSVSNVLNYLLTVENDDIALARLLTLLHGFLMPGGTALREVASEVVDVILVKVVRHNTTSPMLELCALSVLSVVFNVYTLDVPQQDICDILFWLLPQCVSGTERAMNHSRMVLSTISDHHVRTFGGTGEAGVAAPLLQYYKNLLVSSCVRELRTKTSTAENVARVLYVLLSTNQLGVKDLFDITLELDRFCQSSESPGIMPNLNTIVEPRTDVNLHGLYCYAFIARYIDIRYDVLLQPLHGIPKPSLQGDPSASRESISDSTKCGTSVGKGCHADNPFTGIITDGTTAPETTSEAGETISQLKDSMEVFTAEASGDIATTALNFEDKRLAVATLIATRCRYHLCETSTEARHVALFALHRCISAFSNNVPVMRIRLYESWDPLFVCMEQNMRNLRIMTSIFGIFTLGVRHAYDFVERWLVDILDKLGDMLIEECAVNSVTNADEANRSIRFKFAVAMLNFVLGISSRVVNRVLFSKLLLVTLLMCRSTAPAVEKLAGAVLVNLFHKNPPLIRNVVMHIGSDDAASGALLQFALKRDLQKLLPQAAKMRCLLGPHLHI